MGIPVLILGETGSGKTYSIKNFNVDEVGIFSVEKGRLPFKKPFKMVKNAGYDTIVKTLRKSPLKRFVIDDSQYLLVNELFDRANETGYQKYTDMAVHFRNLVHMVNRDLPDDVIVYFLHHTEYDTQSGRTKAKTVGKMIDQYLTLEGCFDIVLQAVKTQEGHKFKITADPNNSDTVKVPEGMLSNEDSDLEYVDNDLSIVDACIRDYYGLEASNDA